MEFDDLTSFVRYMLYINEFDNQGFIYTSSKYHWKGDGKGTEFFLPDREYNTSQTSWRPTGTTSFEDQILRAYTEVYPTLGHHDAAFPTPQEVSSTIKIGNVEFEGEMAKDTDGSNHIKKLLLDKDPRTLYLQAWGGTNTIARALKSIEEQYSSLRQWPHIKDSISRKAVILASGFQDETYAAYVAPNWPALRVMNLEAAYTTWGYNCNSGDGNTRGFPDSNVYYSGAWTKANILKGPLGSLYRTWLDGQTTYGEKDQLDVFGDPVLALKIPWCKPQEQYAFLSEGDNVAFNPILVTGIDDPSRPTLGGWGGRLVQNSTSPDLWVLDTKEKAKNGTAVVGPSYTTLRWAEAAQNDFAARMQWTLTPEYREANHPPSVNVDGGEAVKARPGASVKLSVRVSDPDGDNVTVSWFQYLEEGTYPGMVEIAAEKDDLLIVVVPEDAITGQTISVIVQATDDGRFPLTRYDRVFIHVV
ncbi:DUF1593-domain-containing protein [Plenodomus tracheiphilus IPT5]|uniref:DUF1593-domain-containing protein n=1 Tax=Plenodomus tracheiphilus IPT5 TaxID=1408161 RepID=A0A6A7B690_9PLEO|nr:DUF1593-domain-containing protein [Plenodomus tracheiphilus IPT5]